MGSPYQYSGIVVKPLKSKDGQDAHCVRLSLMSGETTTQRTVRLILGDQLNARHSWFREPRAEVVYVMAELRQELTYTRHHIQKACAFIRSMRNFADALTASGHEVKYFRLDESLDFDDLPALLQACIEETDAERFEYQMPDEYRLDQQLSAFCESLGIETAVFDSEHFMTSREDLARFFEGKKTYLMENFYRDIRRRTGILMQDDKPEGDRWNFDADNRNRLPKDHVATEHLLFDEDVSDIVRMLQAHDIPLMGEMAGDRLPWPTTRKQSREVLEHFLEHHLHSFGTYQDAMTDSDSFIYHSRISFSLNSKMLHPREVVDSVVDHWRQHSTGITLAQVEGYVRQIIGWREYMRGVYWARMPEYASTNFFDHDRELPAFYWNGDTRMHCMAHSITQSLEVAHAHHIQRLMVTGNFALLIGADPDAVDAWYLGIYIDAIEWVEITNTRGMSQFADGGLLATKPYVSSGNYINKMSDYCKRCHYSVKQKSGEGSCPFNSLYWHFMERHHDTLSKNARIGMIYRGWAKRPQEERDAILQTAEVYLSKLDEL